MKRLVTNSLLIHDRTQGSLKDSHDFLRSYVEVSLNKIAGGVAQAVRASA
jgi:hypothetical protein